MALDTRLIGQAFGEGRPLRLSQAVGQAVAKGEQAILRSRAQEQRRKELQAQAISQLPQLDESKVPMQMREWAIGQALETRNVALNAIRNKDMDPVERQMAISDAQQSISKIAAKTNDFKQWIAQFADTQPDDLSKLNSPELMERVNDIYSGKFKVSGDQFVFEDGTVKDFNSLINTRHISRRSDAYTSQLQTLGAEYEKYGLQGWDEKAFDSKIDNELANTKYTDADLASIAVDELGLPASEIKEIQDDFEDNGILDEYNKEDLVRKIKDQYRTAAKNAYDNARRLYEEKTKPKPTKPEGLTPSQQLKEIKEQREYVDRVTLASQDLGKIEFDDINSISTASGGKVVVFEKDEEGNPNPGGKTIIIDDNIIIPEDMTEAQKMRKIVEARVANKMLEQKDVPNLLMSLKITGEEMQTKTPTATELLAKYQ